MDVNDVVNVPGYEFTVPIKVFQKMCIRNAHFYELSSAETWDGLDENLRRMFLLMDYINIVAPLVHNDKSNKQHSWEHISRTYLIPKTSIRRIYERIEEILASNGTISP